MVECPGLRSHWDISIPHPKTLDPKSEFWVVAFGMGLEFKGFFCLSLLGSLLDELGLHTSMIQAGGDLLLAFRFCGATISLSL